MKVCLVLEGGGMRAIYTCGVLDFLMENKINVDKIVGVSAGALYGVNYFSKQPHRALRYNKKYCKIRKNIEKNDFKKLLLTWFFIAMCYNSYVKWNFNVFLWGNNNV